MKGAIVVNGYYKNESYTHQAERIAEELEKRKFNPQLYHNDKPVHAGQKFDWDYAVFLDKDAEFARILEHSGVRVFNSAFALELADSKIKTAVYLSTFEDIVMPLTVPAPLKYSALPDGEFLRKTVEILGFPLVVKADKGSLGEQVLLAKNINELTAIAEYFGNKPHLYQQYVAESKGKSVRVIVVGGKIVCAMQLVNENDFRSNSQQGGVAESVELDEVYTQAALRIAEYMDLDYCGIDFFYGAGILIEVNANAFFKKAEEITGANVAGAYADLIITTMGENYGRI